MRFGLLMNFSRYTVNNLMELYSYTPFPTIPHIAF